MSIKFRFLLDPLFILSLVLYLVNKLQILENGFWNSKFSSYYLNDMLLVPVLVPIILFISWMFKIRNDDIPPTFLEILIPLTIWSIAFELIGPLYFGKGTSDPLDVFAYFLGGAISWIIWNRSNLLNHLRAQNNYPLGD